MLRRRFEEGKPQVKTQENDEEPSRKSIHSFSSVFAVVAIILGVLLYDGIVKLSDRTPEQLKISDEKNHPDSFIGERAQNHLKQLSSIGPKVAGSYENEVLAVDFLKREINFIVQQADRNQEIVLDHQIVSGSYFLDFKPYGLVNIYENVQNVVVRVSSQNNANSSLLINCHFDSVPTSPGSSDDGINCVNMLEVLRILSKQSTRPLNNIVFLFNGAEENPLQAAHGFVTQHKWAKECRSVINLESAGAGWKEILFQAGPGNAFLINAYAKSVPYPFGHSAGEEIFQNNLIPSDTDFRLFRDFGNMPGMDLAFFKNGYVYHTKYDNMDMIKPGVYQSSGENLLALVKTLANSPELATANLNDTKKTVYFDFLNFFFISYSESIAPFINLTVVVLAFGVSLMGLGGCKRGTEVQLILDTFFNIVAMVIGLIFSLLFTVITAVLLDQFGLTMSWYTRPKILFGLYFCPTLIFSSVFIILLNNFDNKDGSLNISMRSQLQIHIVRIMSNGLLFLTSLVLRRISYIFLIPIIFTTSASIVTFALKLECQRRSWIYVYLLHLIIPTVFMMYISSIILQLFIPITGRFGSDRNPELIVGLLSTISCIFISQLFVPLVSLLRRPINVIVGLGLIYVITIGCIAFSNYGFPYSNDQQSPTPQRHWIFHSHREFHDEHGKLIKNDSGYFFLNMDRNSPKAVESYVAQTKSMVPLKYDCDKAIFCGVPIYTSRMIAIASESTWIPAPPPVIHQPVQFEMISKEEVSPVVFRYTFQLSGPDHISIFLSPKPNVSLLRWSFTEVVPAEPAIWDGRPAYFILYGYGKTPEKKYTFWIDMKVHSGHQTNYTMDIVTNGLFIHHDKSRTVDYVQFLKQFPEWTHTTAWFTQYQSWIY